MKKNGFVSISLVYTFFILFLILMTILLNSYTSTRYSLETYRNDIQNELLEMANDDINLYIYAYNNTTNGYELDNNFLIDNTDITDADFKYNLSYCINGGTVTYIKNSSNEWYVNIEATKKDTCFAYFKKQQGEI